MIQRTIEAQIRESLFKGKAVIVYGPRQVGKTTLVKSILSSFPKSRYLTCDDPTVRAMFTNPSLQELQQLLKGYELLVLDEAQRIENIGVTIKLIVDMMPHIQVIAT